MCCFSILDVEFEEPPKKPEKPKGPKEVPEYILASSDFVAVPVPPPPPMYYPGNQQFYQSVLTAPTFAPPKIQKPAKQAAAPTKAAKKKPKSGSSAPRQVTRVDGQSQPLEFVPEVPTGNTKYWCQELDGFWELKTTNDIMTTCQPGDWRRHPTTGYPYFVRKAPQK